MHESAGACAMERVRHLGFMRRHLLTPLCAAVAAPLSLAFTGAPAPWETAAFGLAMMPLAAVAAVSRRGALAEARLIGLVALGGLACVAAIAAGPGFGAALFLLLLPLEAAFARSGRQAVAAGVVAASLGLALFGASALGWIPRAGHAPAADAALGFCALAYAVALAFSFIEERQVRDALLAREREEHASLRALVADLRLTFNRAGAVVSFAADGAAFLGLRPREFSGRGFFERVQVADRPVFLKALSDAARDGARIAVRVRLRGPDAESARGQFAEPVFHDVEIRARHLAGTGDEALIVALLRDVTEHVAAAPQPAVSADSAWKDRLLANVSHELRTPLNAIIGFSEMLGAAKSPDDARRREYAEIINASGQHLLSLVNSILDMSKIEAGRFQIAAEAFDPRPLIDACCDIVRLKAQDAGVAIARDIRGNVGELVADKRAFRQILLNLLSNAIKFTPDGGRVSVAARVEGEFIALAVADTGVGVSIADLPRLGDPFFQAHSSCDRANEGTGLGLSVVKGLVGLHGGAISFESAPGQGTCVTVRLPRDCRAADPAPESATIEIIPRRAAAATVHDVTMVKKIA